MVELLMEGFRTNLVMTVLAMQLPLGLGILCCYLAKLNRVAETVFRWVSLSFEILCPVVVMTLFYYEVFPEADGLFAVTIALSVCFLGYMPTRYNFNESVLKNILYNGLGLFSALFKWSFCVGMVAEMDLLRAANIVRNNTHNTIYIWIVVGVSILVLLLAEVGRRLIKQFMK